MRKLLWKSIDYEKIVGSVGIINLRESRKKKENYFHSAFVIFIFFLSIFSFSSLETEKFAWLGHDHILEISNTATQLLHTHIYLARVILNRASEKEKLLYLLTKSYFVFHEV